MLPYTNEIKIRDGTLGNIMIVMFPALMKKKIIPIH